MGTQQRASKVTTWSASDTTVGNCLLVSVVNLGSAALGTLTILDGTAVKYVIPTQITAGGQLVFANPVGFSNLIADNTGTGAFSITYVPVP